MEQSPRLIEAAPKYVGRERDRTTCICLGLQVRICHKNLWRTSSTGSAHCPRRAEPLNNRTSLLVFVDIPFDIWVFSLSTSPRQLFLRTKNADKDTPTPPRPAPPRPAQDFFPPEDTYDLVWIQWVVGHFTDVDFLKLVNRCRASLRKGGLVVIKDNVVEEGVGAFKVDSEDSSLTRSLGYFRSLFNHGGVRVVHQTRQDGFPGELFPVYMFALE